MLLNILYGVILILIIIRFLYPTTIIINSSTAVLLSMVALILLSEHSGVEVIVCSAILIMVGVYRTKYYWKEMSAEEDNVWRSPVLIVISSIALGCMIILINDYTEVLNKVTIKPLNEISIVSVFLTTFLFLRLRGRQHAYIFNMYTCCVTQYYRTNYC
jgi:hypothetical protein